MKCDTMIDIDQIWADVDALRGCEPTRESGEGHTRNSAFLKAAVCASCGGAKVVTCEGMPVCQECGLVENMYMHEGAEWISSFGEDGVITDNSRCPLSERNPELFSAQWGNSTTIQTNRASKVPLKRMAKINFHQSMCHKDRALYHAYLDIDDKGRDIPENVRARAKYIYMKFCERELTRGNVRLGIRANCLLHACKAAGVPRTMKEIATLWDIDPKHMSRTAQRLRDVLAGIDTQGAGVSARTNPKDVLQRLFMHFQDVMEHGDRRRMNEMCDDIAKSTAMQSRTPATVAAVVVSINMHSKLSKLEIATRCDVSLQTLTRMEDLVKQCLHLEK